jgi:hypothetical protein
MKKQTSRANSPSNQSSTATTITTTIIITIMTSFFWDYVTSSALSLTVSGTVGISPFLTLLLLGVVEISDPSLLNMGNTMEAILGSWYSIVILSILTLLEVISKCIPALDEIVDSVEIFLVPILSVFGTLGTLGVFNLILANETNEENGDMVPIDEERRILGESGGTWLTVWKIFLVIWGIGLALLIHIFKMIIRISGLIFCMGCCQPCITVLEISVVCCGVFFAIFIRQIAVVLCIIFLLAAVYTIKVKYFTKEEEGEGQNNNGHTEQPKLPTTEPPAKTTIDNGQGDNSGESPPDMENPPPYNPSSKQNDFHTNGSGINSDIPPPNAPSFTSKPGAGIVSIAEITPMPPPPSTNPNYVVTDEETPMAIAIPVVDEDCDVRQKSIPDTNKKENKNPPKRIENKLHRKGNSVTKGQDKQIHKDSAVVY